MRRRVGMEEREWICVSDGGYERHYFTDLKLATSMKPSVMVFEFLNYLFIFYFLNLEKSMHVLDALYFEVMCDIANFLERVNYTNNPRGNLFLTKNLNSDDFV